MSTASSATRFATPKQRVRHSLPLKRANRFVGLGDDIGDIDDAEVPTSVPGNASDSQSPPASTQPHIRTGAGDYNDAYIVAKILKLNCFQMHPEEANPGGPVNSRSPSGTSWKETRSVPQAAYVHPMAVTQLRHLMRHFGILVILLLGLQIWAAWCISAFADQYLPGGRHLHLTIHLSLMMIANTCVWYHQRGKLSVAFHLPGAVLFIFAVLPIAVLHLRHVLSLAG